MTPESVLFVESKVSYLDAGIHVIILKTIGFSLIIGSFAASLARLLDVPKNL